MLTERQHATEGTWTLFWQDRNNVWHRDPIEPTPQVDRLLAQITDDTANRHWGDVGYHCPFR